MKKNKNKKRVALSKDVIRVLAGPELQVSGGEATCSISGRCRIDPPPRTGGGTTDCFTATCPGETAVTCTLVTF